MENMDKVERDDVERVKPLQNFLEFFQEKENESNKYVSIKSPPFEESESLFHGFKKFSYASHVPKTHKFFCRNANFNFKPKSEEDFNRAHARDIFILRSNIPSGILVKGFEGTKELFSALIFGPANSPYEGGVFAFDIKLPEDYPSSPPEFRSFSFKITEGISDSSRGAGVRDFLFRTWQANHCWTRESSLLDILVSIQSMIAKPYGVFTGGLEGALLVNPNIELTASTSKKFNESVVLFFLVVMVELLEEPPFPWKIELAFLLRTEIPRLVKRYQGWLGFDEKTEVNPFNVPLLPFEQTWEVEKLMKRLRSLEHQYYTKMDSRLR